MENRRHLSTSGRPLKLALVEKPGEFSSPVNDADRGTDGRTGLRVAGTRGFVIGRGVLGGRVVGICVLGICVMFVRHHWRESEDGDQQGDDSGLK